MCLMEASVSVQYRKFLFCCYLKNDLLFVKFQVVVPGASSVLPLESIMLEPAYGSYPGEVRQTTSGSFLEEGKQIPSC